MKKYFTKIIITSLIAIVFSVVNASCFYFMPTGSAVNTNIAHAASNNDNVVNTNMDVCGKNDINTQQKKPVAPAPASNQHNSFLPCCIDGGHLNNASLSQSDELLKSFPVIFSIAIIYPPAVFEHSAYFFQNTSPPKLLSIKTTVLRL